MLSKEDGELLIKVARKAIKTYLENKMKIEPPMVPSHLKEKRGVFVTLNKNGDLRGCIGFPEPIKPLIDGVIEAAIAAATSDPRFPPVTLDELNKIRIEVSVLTKPEPIEVEDPREYPKMIKVGKDGLIIERGFYKGLLLPQVAIEWGFDEEEFLCNTCLKAGLPPDCWYDNETKIYKFQAQIFHEKT
ncbi:MAG TPA: TIGR00296 family protein [Methanothermobacter sp.]|nr:protein Mfer_1263 [Methanothermobacter sp. MT-2]HHW05313.1 TIGR00296 family protein [Methanothermobacter sp.]HOK72925.1 TIGR00296 family protein [Methanothermobacter sp.]HOL68989.1 TIGR00296 family protein [Methanothermobacter sp.]HPQ04874.1 TIGR00296 family protein [Methanothermobacter sp.]